jgi:hypothetical protein
MDYICDGSASTVEVIVLFCRNKYNLIQKQLQARETPFEISAVTIIFAFRFYSVVELF